MLLGVALAIVAAMFLPSAGLAGIARAAAGDVCRRPEGVRPGEGDCSPAAPASSPPGRSADGHSLEDEP
jgi:hypothetical protein